uniref:Uncharacterized protein n=1 Tax=Oryza brachyantha TaxID=4533 RepID=J3M4S9_ORYBR
MERNCFDLGKKEEEYGNPNPHPSIPLRDYRAISRGRYRRLFPMIVMPIVFLFWIKICRNVTIFPTKVSLLLISVEIWYSWEYLRLKSKGTSIMFPEATASIAVLLEMVIHSLLAHHHCGFPYSGAEE